MRNEDLLAAYLDADPDDRRAIEAGYPEMTSELRSLEETVGRVRSSARYASSAGPGTLPAWSQLRLLREQARPLPLWLTLGAAVASVCLMLSDNKGQAIALEAMLGWLAVWFTVYFPGRRALI